jgi:ornithine carbamoyltransferase
MKKQTKHVLSVTDLSAEEIDVILKEAIRLKKQPLSDDLKGHFLALIFEKPSLRTRVSFEIANQAQGGGSLVLPPSAIQMGKREAIKDVAAYLSGNVTSVTLRVFDHQTLVKFAEFATVPVINALSDVEHPCQALADVMTVLQHKGSLEGKRLMFIGDGNNVCHSLLLAGALTGLSVTVACPEGYEPDEKILAQACEIGSKKGAEFVVTNNPQEAAKNADAIYTDVWASMGQEDEVAARKKIFQPFQLNSELLALAPEAIVMHCLPAHRGEEITDAVIDGPQSVVFDQAENRRHAQKALLRFLLMD